MVNVFENFNVVPKHRCTQGGWGGIKVYPPSEIIAKLVNKNAIKHQKGVPSQKIFYNPYIPSLPKFGKNLIDPPPRISDRVHLSNKQFVKIDLGNWSRCGFGCQYSCRAFATPCENPVTKGWAWNWIKNIISYANTLPVANYHQSDFAKNRNCVYFMVLSDMKKVIL